MAHREDNILPGSAHLPKSLRLALGAISNGPVGIWR
jgi:hypothetical protein